MLGEGAVIAGAGVVAGVVGGIVLARLAAGYVTGRPHSRARCRWPAPRRCSCGGDPRVADAGGARVTRGRDAGAAIRIGGARASRGRIHSPSDRAGDEGRAVRRCRAAPAGSAQPVSAALRGPTERTDRDGVDRRAKYLLAPVVRRHAVDAPRHVGSFRVNAAEAAGSSRDPRRAPRPRGLPHVVRRDRHLQRSAAVRFHGSADSAAADRHPALSLLGPEPLSAAFDAAALAQACRGKKTSLKVALLDQRVVAGLGNIYVVEALHLARLSPLRQASTIATPSGVPRPAAMRLAAAIKQVLMKPCPSQRRLPRRVSRLRSRRRAVPAHALLRHDCATHARPAARPTSARSANGSPPHLGVFCSVVVQSLKACATV